MIRLSSVRHHSLTCSDLTDLPQNTQELDRIPRLHSEIHTGNLKNEEVLLFGMTKMASRESGTKRLAVDLSTQADSELAQAQTRFSLLPSKLAGTDMFIQPSSSHHLHYPGISTCVRYKLYSRVNFLKSLNS